MDVTVGPKSDLELKELNAIVDKKGPVTEECYYISTILSSFDAIK